MSSLSFTTSFRKNEGLIFSPSELREIYLHGVVIKDQSGNELPDSAIKTFIQAAQKEVEDQLDILIHRQVVNESRDYFREDFFNWSFIRVSKPVRKAFKLDGKIGADLQRTYPEDWLQEYRTNVGRKLRQVHLIPNKGTAEIQDIFFTTTVFLRARERIPNYWDIYYTTGFDKVPSDLLEFIGKFAAIKVFHIAGDLILGAGIASQSLGIDGLSQSISTTSSATNAGYGARIEGYLRDLKDSWPRMKNYYKGVTMSIN